MLKPSPRDVYRNLVIHVPLDATKYVRVVEFKTGGAPVHHAVIRVDRTTTFEVNDIVAAGELVRNDLGVCILPRSIAARFPDLTWYDFRHHAPHWKIMLVRPPGEASPAVAALWRHFT